jgi:hypothetical protein
MPQSTPHFELLARVLDAFEFEDAASRMRAAETLVTAALMHRITGAVPATSIEGPVPQRLALLQVIESLARGAAELFLFGHGLDTGKPPQSALQTASVYAWSSIMGHDRPRPTIMFDQVALSQPVKASELKQLLTCPACGLSGMMAGVSEDARVQWVFASEDGPIFRQSVFQKGLALRVRRYAIKRRLRACVWGERGWVDASICTRDVPGEWRLGGGGTAAAELLGGVGGAVARAQRSRPRPTHPAATDARRGRGDPSVQEGFPGPRHGVGRQRSRPGRGGRRRRAVFGLGSAALRSHAAALRLQPCLPDARRGRGAALHAAMGAAAPAAPVSLRQGEGTQDTQG